MSLSESTSLSDSLPNVSTQNIRFFFFFFFFFKKKLLKYICFKINFLFERLVWSKILMNINIFSIDQ
jgi:hypothetical protein